MKNLIFALVIGAVLAGCGQALKVFTVGWYEPEAEAPDTTSVVLGEEE